MDIVRRYDRPQSSTSELLSSLVELGLLYKDPFARSYRPTVRAALLGATSQQGSVRDGRLIQLLDRLVAQTGLPVLLVAKIGLDAQIVTARQGSNTRLRRAAGLRGGMREPLTHGAVGQLLLSTLPETKREAALRRLNSEADDADKFVPAEMMRQIAECGRTGLAVGQAGFGTRENMVAMLLPGQDEEAPLAACIVMDKPGQYEALAQCLCEAVENSLVHPGSDNVEPLATAA